jgi:AcrR family transcriptional regulator
MAWAVAEKGYAAVTLADVVERAEVSRRTFYEQFEDKEACFLAAYDTGVELVLGAIRRAVDPIPEGDWRRRARVSVKTFLEVLAAEPYFAWALVIEVMGAGRAALKRHGEIMELFAQVWSRLYDLARNEDRSLPSMPHEVFTTLAAGSEGLVREALHTQGARSLPKLHEPILRAVFAIFGTS